jgi:tetraacyldisaccharide 4'-kinase
MPSLLERIWYRDAPGWARYIEPGLALASAFYAMGLRADQAAKRSRKRNLPRPVLSVGNLTVGGTGKTPVTRWLADCCVEMGKVPCILTRGYGSTGIVPREVNPNTATWQEFGDEPVLLARSLKAGCVYVGRDRWAAGDLALRAGKQIDLFILDDGFQHLQLERDVDVVLVDGERGFGNGHLLPHGPLREPVAALGRAEVVGTVFRSAQEGAVLACVSSEFTIELGAVGWRFLGEQEVRPLDCLPITSPVYLLSGIASPQGFEKTIGALGLIQAGHAAYQDHYSFSRTDVHHIRDLADHLGARVVTTAKDGIRLEEHLSVWTQEPLPIIIELGLKHGDGTEYLTSILKGMFTRGRDL